MSLKALPVNTAYSVHQILVPSLGKKLRFRPFLVKENKMLMIAQASENVDTMIDTLKQIIANCCVESEPLDVDNLATFDLEYLLVKLRVISVDDSITLEVTCDDPHDGYDEKTRKTRVHLNLDDIEIVGLKDYTRKIKLSDDLYVLMKLPSLGMLNNIPEGNDIDANLSKLGAQIDKICTSEEVFDASEYTPAEILNWLLGLTETQLANLLKYFENIPYCRIKVEWTCPHCGKRNIRYIEGLSYFF